MSRAAFRALRARWERFMWKERRIARLEAGDRRFMRLGLTVNERAYLRGERSSP